jgi:hypothetical protein
MARAPEKCGLDDGATSGNLKHVIVRGQIRKRTLIELGTVQGRT